MRGPPDFQKRRWQAGAAGADKPAPHEGVIVSLPPYAVGALAGAGFAAAVTGFAQLLTVLFPGVFP